jgi:tetratricopeptide (TPR) repeat protein/tRNA A-37 threonylcarbamoyl transferase component Bud32
MSRLSPPPGALPFLDEEARIDALCDEFEAEWQQGRRPPLESYLGRMSGPVHCELLRALLRVELEYRHAAAERPALEEYWGRFPGYRVLIRDVFEERAAGGGACPPLHGWLADLLDTPALAPRATPAGRPFPAPALPAAAPGTSSMTPTEPWAPSGHGGHDAGCPVRRPPAAGLPAIPGYVILGLMHQGGMGVIYLAEQVRLNRVVALKMIRAQWADDDCFRARFDAEAAAVAALKHPHIIQIYDKGEHQGQVWFAMEYVPGGTLQDRLARALFSPRQAAELVEVLARAVHVVHGEKIVHRDLKPANILIAADGTPKIADFGLVKWLDAPGGLTHYRELVGTPCYMAPEQVASVKAVGPGTDVYALGVILYEILTGRPPFRGPTSLETLKQVLLQEPPRPGRLRKLPRDLETICMKCLEKDPRKRYRSAEELADRLRLFLDGRPIPDRPPSSLGRLGKWARRRPAAATLVAVTLLALGLSAYIGWQVWQGRHRLGQARQTVAAALAHVERLLAGDEWRAARDKLPEPKALLDREPVLAEEFAEAFGRLRRAVERRASAEAAREKSRAAHAEFKRFVNEGLVNAADFAGLELPGQRARAAAAARKALGLFGMDRDGATAPVLVASHFAPAEREDIAADCYTLLALLADAPAGAGTPGLRARAEALRRALPPRWQVLDSLVEGVRSYRANRFAAALGHFETIATRRPDFFWAHYLGAVCHLRCRRADRARDSLTTCAALARKAGGDLVWVYLLRGVAHGELGKAARVPDTAARYFAAAAEDFRHADGLLPPDSEGENRDARYVLLVNRAAVSALEGRDDRAVPDLQAAVRLRPELFHAHRGLARVHQDRGRYAEALAAYGRALERQPDLALLHYERGELHCAWQQARARDGCARSAGVVGAAAAGPLAMLPPLVPGPTGPRGAVTLAGFTAAPSPAQGPDLSAALRDFDRAVKLYEGNEAPTPTEQRLLAEAHLARGKLLSRRGRWQDALAAFAEAARLRPSLAVAARWRAYLLQRQGQYREAVAAYDTYFQSGGPAAADVYEARGVCRQRLGDYLAAAADFTRALALDPARPEALRARGWIGLLTGNPEQALRDFEAALARDAADGDNYAGRGLARAQLGRHREALEDAEQAWARGPQTARHLYKSARVFAWLCAGKGARPGQELSRAQHASCEKRAVDLLCEALAVQATAAERSKFLRLIFAEDAILAPVRRHPGLERLAREYRQIASASAGQGR